MIAWIKRFFREWLIPAEKCQRVGHNPYRTTLKRWEYPGEGTFRSVADDVTYSLQRCRRCNAELSRKEVYRTHLTGLSMPADMMEKLETDGVLNHQ